jgi:hypothetical protein
MHQARAEHYAALSRAGDPERRINAIEEDFNAGYRAALAAREEPQRVTQPTDQALLYRLDDALLDGPGGGAEAPLIYAAQEIERLSPNDPMPSCLRSLAEVLGDERARIEGEKCAHCKGSGNHEDGYPSEEQTGSEDPCVFCNGSGEATAAASEDTERPDEREDGVWATVVINDAFEPTEITDVKFLEELSETGVSLERMFIRPGVRDTEQEHELRPEQRADLHEAQVHAREMERGVEP